ncbi:MAG: ABC transporter permease subunit [Defluviitaleaceae bacterium]|nr:ABC transporter permease subunit [Defluviitaleaceae bacterium]
MYDKQARVKFWGNVLSVALIVVGCFFYLRLDPLRLLMAAPSFVSYIAVNFFPPSTENINVYASAALHTVAVAVVGTFISSALSLIFALLMSEAAMPYRAVRLAVRLFITFLRNIPVIIWASLLAFIFGVGSMVGLIALVLAATGFLSRSYAESLSEIAARKLEPMKASGAGTFAIIRHGLLPEFTPAWMNWTLFSFELAVRASAILGMVGAGGMGTMIRAQLELRRFNEAATMVFMLIVIVLITEFAAGWVRKRYLYEGTRNKKAPPPSRTGKLRAAPLHARAMRALTVLLAAVIFFACLVYIDLDVARFVNRLSNAPRVLRMLVDLNPAMVLPGLRQFLTSFAMGAVGLVFGGMFAFVLAFLAADNIAPWKPLAVLIKAFVSVVRAVPSLVFILMIVAAIGLGYNAGVVVLILSSMGYLTKAFIATIEEQHAGIITAMRATGAGWGQIVVHGLLPAVAAGFLAWVALRLETSVAESVTLGVVGAGGIGTMLLRARTGFDYSTMGTLILIIVICMACLEWGAGKVRKRFC